MRFRKLRIAWTVFWGIACVLLIALWVRSYFICDTLHLKYRAWHYAWIVPERGRIVVELSEIKSNLSGFAIDHIDTNNLRFDTVRDRYWVHVLRMGNLDEIYVPMWLPLLFISALAVTPWIRFSLRTLLIATTLFALVLGAIVYASR